MQMLNGLPVSYDAVTRDNFYELFPKRGIERGEQGGNMISDFLGKEREEGSMNNKYVKLSEHSKDIHL